MKRIHLFFLALGVTVILLFVNIFVRERMSDIIRNDKLVDESFVEQGAPPLVSFTTVALGGFRGLIADVLWLRLIGLQEEGKYFEMVQLADWVQKLQPKFAGASAYLGWNMAYNISVTCKRQEDRWRWIHRGIETLRSAIAMSPNDPQLYKELGWIYQHKMGNVLDDAQRYYKYEMAKEYMFLYGAHYPDWKTLAEAPVKEAEFLAQFKPDSQFMKVMQEVKEQYPRVDDILKEFRLKSDLPDVFKTKLNEKDQVLLSSYLRAKWMRDRYLLNPKTIYEINKEFGDLDWLTPESFAIYWAYLGLAHSPKRQNTDCDRMILQSLNVTFTNGRMLLPDNQASMNFILVPNPSVADAIYKRTKEVLKREENPTSFRAGYENLLKDATVILFSYGRQQESFKFYKEWCKEFRNRKAQEKDFLPFVLAEWEEDLRDGGYKQGNQQITALIFRACELLAYGDNDAAAAHLMLAKRAYDNYMANFTEDRVKLPPFNEMKKNVVENLIKNNPSFAKRLNAELDNQNEPSNKTATPQKAVLPTIK
jgi:hypothetical protein